MFLTLCFAQILEGVGQLVADLVAHHPRDAEAAGIRQGFQAGRDIDAVAEDVVAVDDDVAEVDPDPEPDPSGMPASPSIIARCTSAAQRTASTTLANSTSIPSPVVLTMRPECSPIFGPTSPAAMRLKALVRAFLVGAHQPRVARHIGG